jgi:hypothetical protein
MTRLLIVTVLLATVAVVLALRNRKGVATRSLKVTARAGLSRNVAIVVVEVEGRRLLVGAAANSVNVLAELGPAEAVDGAAVGAPEGRPARTIGPTSTVRPTPGGGTVVDRLRSMTTRSFATDANAKDLQGLL